MPPPGGGAQQVFITRLHVRYDGAHFPEDLVFHETGDRTNFQGRFVIRHPWKAERDCPALDAYLQSLRERYHREAETLADLTGWSMEKIRRRMGSLPERPRPEDETPWWDTIWRN
jgi:hypothetical protein